MRKSRWSKAAPRTREVDGAAQQRRLNERLAQDTRICAWIVTNVRPSTRIDCRQPMVLLGPVTRTLLALRQQYGGDFVGNAVEVDSLGDMPVMQVRVMSPIPREAVPSVCGWENYDVFRAQLLSTDPDGAVADLELSTVAVRVRALLRRMELDLQQQVEAMLSQPVLSTAPAGTCGRVPVYTR